MGEQWENDGRVIRELSKVRRRFIGCMSKVRRFKIFRKIFGKYENYCYICTQKKHWSIKPSLAEKLVDILDFVVDKGEFTTEQIVSHFGFNATTTKRYLRQLTEFGYLEPHGGNKNRTYSKKRANK